MKAQNAVTFGYLDRVAVRGRLKTRLTELWNTPRTGVPFVEAEQLFYTKNTVLQRQSVWFTRGSLQAASGVHVLILKMNTAVAPGSRLP